MKKCIRKEQKNCSFWLDEEWLSPQKEQLFCSFLNVICHSWKEYYLYFLRCQMHQKRTKKCSFWHEEWLSPQKEQFFCSFLNFIFLERRSLVLFALPNASKKDNKLFLLTTWRMALFTKRAFFFCSFLNVIFLEKHVIWTFCLSKCIRKVLKNCSFWLHEQWLSPQKEQLFLVLFWAGGSDRHKNCSLRLAHHQERNLSLSGDENVRPAVLMSTLIAQLVLFPLNIFSVVVECIMRSLSDVGLTSLSSGPLGLWFTWAARPVKKKKKEYKIAHWIYLHLPHSQKKFWIEIDLQKGIWGLLWTFFLIKERQSELSAPAGCGHLVHTTRFVNIPQWYDGSSLISIHACRCSWPDFDYKIYLYSL